MIRNYRRFSLVYLYLALGTIGWVSTNRAVAQSTQPQSTLILLDEWHDAKRADRAMPVKIYYPKSTGGPWPVVLVSHGLGGSRNGLQYEGEYWAEHGYVSVHIQHVGSDNSILKDLPAGGRMAALQAGLSVQQFLNRCNDMKFALDQIQSLNTDDTSPLKGKLDLDKIAVAGHSFGAITVEAMCGEVFHIAGRELSFYDPRIKAGIAFSPSPPLAGDPKVAFAKVKVPMFHWTGTKDQLADISTITPEQRRIPYDSINSTDQYLVILTGGDHMIFNGRPIEDSAAHPDDEAWKTLVQHGTTAFLDTYLRNEAQSKTYLQSGPFAAEVGKYGTFEEKMKKNG